MVIRTGCSVSLIALYEVCMAVLRGDYEGAIVGGANLMLGLGMSVAILE
jgi:acyl transferase domain-containing protein